ncbi:FAD-dependent monooxygenase [Thiomicrospira sp. R3]|uniref:FAD-dependent monooxygenase n=1 Tax=Thiomicrospira sp. R3 TaxID=3035472 RepID=UPI00259B079A|nr:FAD-dependent monooxygenase [Thiomicrospira sp. R3]WFE68760.1 FAD-dependent monooxygenase [Thiomicrospira sp. R3]
MDAKQSINADSDDVEFDYDVIITGGGPVGLCLALALSQKGARICLIEAVEPKPGALNSFDGRVLALSEGSRLILEHIGVWQGLVDYVTDIAHVHVSQKGYLGLTLMHAEELDVPALGYAVRASDLGDVLWKAVRDNAAIELICPASLQDFNQADLTGVSASLITAQGEKTLTARMIVGADGTDSQVRKSLGLLLEQRDYQAWAILAQVEFSRPHHNWAFERFTQEGPVALLPLDTHSHKLVYVASDSNCQEVLALSDTAFIQAFNQKMGERFGACTALSERVAYPLKETYVEGVVFGRAVLMGNASHTQHPVAAQGLNLGLRDVADFLDGLDKDLIDLDAEVRLAHYQYKRQQDHKKVMGLTDGLIRVFEHPSPLVGHARGLAMMGLQLLPRLKKRLAQFSMQGSKV